MRRFLPALYLLLLLFTAALPAQPFIEPLGPDSHEVRRAVLGTWFALPLEKLRSRPPETRTTSGGDVFQIYIIEDKTGGTGLFAVEIVPRSDGIYDAEAPGTWVLTRSAQDGQPRRLQCVLARNLVLQWTFPPPGEATAKQQAAMSLRLFDSYVVRDVPTVVTFERLSTASRTQLQDWFPSLPWHLAKANPGFYGDIRQMIGVIRRNLPRIVIVSDAAYSTDDQSYSVISGLPRPPLSKGGQGGLELSNAGFVKWIADGLVRPLSGNNTLIPPLLKVTGLAAAGTAPLLSTRYNLRFTLDWCRNLADAVDAVTSGRIAAHNYSHTDVTIEPLATGGATVFLPDTGYRAQSLRAILYILAVTDPDTFYLAAIRETDRDVMPEVNFFNNAAVIFPHFTPAGTFDVVIFENGTEMPLNAFLQKYADTFIYLSRVAASDYFFPQ